MTRARLTTAVVGVAAALTTCLSAPAEAASPDTRAWAPADSATIYPGVQTYVGSAQCTAGAVFTDDAGNVYLSQAAHCTGDASVGTSVEFWTGASLGKFTGSGTVSMVTDYVSKKVGAGTIAYNSKLTQAAVGIKDPTVLRYNDFELVKVNAADVGKVNPSMPVIGGPTGLNTSGLSAGETVYGYGDSVLRLGIQALSPKVGVTNEELAGGWSHSVLLATPGIEGDSGSTLIDANGKATGVFSSLRLGPLDAPDSTRPLPGTDEYGDMAHEVAFAQKYSGISGLRLVPGTEPFKGLGG